MRSCAWSASSSCIDGTGRRGLVAGARQPELAGAPVDQAVQRKIPAEAQRLARQLRRHSEIVAHAAAAALTPRSRHDRALLRIAQRDKELFSCRLLSHRRYIATPANSRWNRHDPPFQRRRLHPRRQGRPGQARLARALRQDGGERRLAHGRSRPIWPASWPRRVRFYLATASADGQPYVQHRGGPPGFLRVVDERTLGFADFKGNRQYITTGNLAENRKAFIFVMDYAQRRRVKLWGRARVVEDDAALLAQPLARGLQGAPRAGDRVRGRGLGHQLPAAHPADVPRRGRGPHHRCSSRPASASWKPRWPRSRTGGWRDVTP